MKTKKSPKGKKATTAEQPTLISLLLDRTGSMALCMEETINGFNGYVDKMTKEPGNFRFRFTQFDSLSIDVLHDNVPMDKVMRLNKENFKPRDCTPLYDAIGKTIRSTEKEAGGSKVLFVTLTDGQENASHEWNHHTVQAEIKRKESDGWTFAYIGVSPSSWDQVANIAKGTNGISNVLRATYGNTHKVYDEMVLASCCVSHSAGGQSVNSVFSGKQLDKDDE